MRISLLKTIEDFEHTLSASLAFFFQQESKSSVSVKFKNKYNRKATHLVYDYLNVIARTSEPPANIRRACLEYAHSRNTCLEILQKIYVLLSASFILRRFFCSSALLIENLPSDFESVIIRPGNNSIRLINLNSEVCTVISKLNVPFPDNLLKVRQEIFPTMIPRIIESDPENKWFCEKFLTAIPFNRLRANQTSTKEPLEKSFLILEKLREKTTEQLPLDVWMKNRFARIRQYLETSNFSQMFPEITTYELDSLEVRFLAVPLFADELIEVCLSHGDFQLGNILVSPCNARDNCFLIDWEYADRRIWFYDHFTLATRARERLNLDISFEILIKVGVPQNEIEKLRELEHRVGHKVIKILFVVEELILRLHEIARRSKVVTSQGVGDLFSALQNLIDEASSK